MERKNLAQRNRSATKAFERTGKKTMAKRRNAASSDGREDTRAMFKKIVDGTWEPALQKHGFQLIAHQDEGLFSSFLYGCNKVLASISVDWREGDIESRVGVADDDDNKNRITSIWDTAHHMLLETYTERVTPETWRDLRDRIVANVRMPSESLTYDHIQRRIAFLTEAVESVLPMLLRESSSILDAGQS